jgi:hypothetical protein
MKVVAYVRKKKSKGKEYYQLVEGYREDGRVKQRVLAHLGDIPTVEGALRDWPERIDAFRKAAEENRREVEFVAKRLGNEPVRRKARPHTYATARKLMDEFEIGTPEWRSAFDTDVRRHYWQHIDYAERLEREAAALEERLTKLRELQEQGKA